jgi:hypothetical protein
VRYSLILAVISSFSAFAVQSTAGIEETEAQLVQRFGDVQERKPERTLEAGRVYVVGERIVFKRANWRVTAVLLDGICAKITYVRSGPWSESQYAELLSTNAGDGNWREIVGGAPKWQRAWQRSDGIVARWKYAGGFVVEAQSFVDARERVRVIARQETAVLGR